MTEKPATSDWATARGEKWRRNAAGTEAMLAPVNPPLIAALSLDAALRIADIGSGGGATTLDILRRAPRGSVVHGFDISPALVDLARSRIPAGEPAVAFEVADMAAAPPRQLFDRLVSRFGVMFFDNPSAAFANLAQWLVPGGRLAFAVWGPPNENRWHATVRETVSAFVDVPGSDPDAPGPFRYAEAATLLAVLDHAGFSGLASTTWRGLLSIGGGLPPADAATFALASFSTFGELLTNAGGGVFDDARQRLTERFAEHQDGGVVRLPAIVHIVRGIRV
jgi:SAM-dependent methyltransferase